MLDIIEDDPLLKRLPDMLAAFLVLAEEDNSKPGSLAEAMHKKAVAEAIGLIREQMDDYAAERARRH